MLRGDNLKFRVNLSLYCFSLTMVYTYFLINKSNLGK